VNTYFTLSEINKHKPNYTHSDTPLIVWSPPEQIRGCAFEETPSPFARIFKVSDFHTFLSSENANPIQLSSTSKIIDKHI
jgi:hypothetical protein